jgi:3-hydroxybutyrate dehydrogenase
MASKGLEGKVVLITGGLGGFGQAMARAFADEGTRVVLSDLKPDGESTANGVRGRFLQADISDGAQVKALCDRVIELEGGVDVLVNNAGYQHIDPVDEFDEDTWSTMIEVMLIAPFRLTKHLVPGMKERGWGRIINMASIHGLVASPYKSAYNSAKHGLVGLTRTVALEVGEYGITVNAICPGFSRTPLTEMQIEDQARTRGIPVQEVVEKVMLEPAAIKRLVEPDEVAQLAVFLASEHARSITGTTQAIDAGWTAR